MTSCRMALPCTTSLCHGSGGSRPPSSGVAEPLAGPQPSRELMGEKWGGKLSFTRIRKKTNKRYRCYQKKQSECFISTCFQSYPKASWHPCVGAWKGTAATQGTKMRFGKKIGTWRSKSDFIALFSPPRCHSSRGSSCRCFLQGECGGKICLHPNVTLLRATIAAER